MSVLRASRRCAEILTVGIRVFPAAMSEKSKTPAELRAMAQRARALAHDVPDDVMSARLLEIAAELEAQADAQERQNPP